MRYVSSKLKQVLQISTVIGIAATFTACSLEMPNGKQQLLSIELPTGKASLLSNDLQRSLKENESAPMSWTEFNCFAVNVTGIGVKQDPRLACTRPGAKPNNLGIIAGFASAQGGKVEVMVPAGPARKIELMGLVSSTGSCPNIEEVLNSMAVERNPNSTATEVEAARDVFDHLSNPLKIGEGVADVFDDNSRLNITLTYDPLQPEAMIDDCDGVNVVRPSHVFLGYQEFTGTSPTTIPSPLPSLAVPTAQFDASEMTGRVLIPPTNLAGIGNFIPNANLATDPRRTVVHEVTGGPDRKVAVAQIHFDVTDAIASGLSPYYHIELQLNGGHKGTAGCPTNLDDTRAIVGVYNPLLQSYSLIGETWINTNINPPPTTRPISWASYASHWNDTATTFGDGLGDLLADIAVTRPDGRKAVIVTLVSDYGATNLNCKSSLEIVAAVIRLSPTPRPYPSSSSSSASTTTTLACTWTDRGSTTWEELSGPTSFITRITGATYHAASNKYLFAAQTNTDHIMLGTAVPDAGNLGTVTWDATEVGPEGKLLKIRNTGGNTYALGYTYASAS